MGTPMKKIAPDYPLFGAGHQRTFAGVCRRNRLMHRNPEPGHALAFFTIRDTIGLPAFDASIDN